MTKSKSKRTAKKMAKQTVDFWGPVNEINMMVQDLARSSAYIHKLAKLARV